MKKCDVNRPFPPDFVSAETLAYRLDCSRTTIDEYVRLGFLPQPESVGNLIRWDFDEVRAKIKAQNDGTAEGGFADPYMRGAERAQASQN